MVVRPVGTIECVLNVLEGLFATIVHQSVLG